MFGLVGGCCLCVVVLVYFGCVVGVVGLGFGVVVVGFRLFLFVLWLRLIVLIGWWWFICLGDGVYFGVVCFCWLFWFVVG